MNATVYDPDTGQIIRTLSYPDGMLPHAVAAHESWIEGFWPDDQYYVVAGAPVALPVQPSEHHTFDWASKAWIDPRTLADHQAAAWERIKLDRAAAAVAPLTVGQHIFDADPTSQQLITGAAQMALLAQSAGQPWQIEWTLADNSSATLTAPDMLAVALALAAQVDAAHQRGRLLRAQIYAATDPHQLNNITWHAP